MYHAIARPNHMRDWPNVHGLKALALGIRNLVSDPLHDNRFGRERPKRVRMKALKRTSAWDEKVHLTEWVNFFEITLQSLPRYPTEHIEPG